MDVRFNDEQNLLRDSARDFLSTHCPTAVVRAAADGDVSVVDALWRKAGELGWTGLTVGVEHGGSGLGLVDLCVLFEETGAALMPGALFSTVAFAVPCLAAAEAAERASDLLARVASGSARLSVAQIEEGNGWSLDAIRTSAAATTGGYALRGEKRFVYDASAADALIVPAYDDARELLLLAIDPASAGVRIEDTAYVDQTRSVARVTLTDVHVDRRDVVAHGGRAMEALLRAHDVARVALCAEMIGGARRVLDLSVEYAKTREQFGSPIGRFQAIQHKCANMLVLLESARSATYYAAWAVDNDEPDARASALMAKAYVCEAYSRIAGDGIQIHGGMGFTWEADLHLYFKRAKSDEALLGSPAYLREQAARLLIDEPA